MEYRDYYQLLGVSKTATEKEIKSAFRKLAQKYHPDKNLGDPRAEGKFKEINEAYEVLGDPEKRAKYDRLGASYAQWERAGQPEGFDFDQWAAAMRGQGQPGQSRRYEDLGDLSDILGGAGFSDFFNTIFGGMGTDRGSRGSTRRPSTLRGNDLEQALEITLEEVATGAKRTLQKGERRLEVSIPPGAKTGTKVRITGEGGNGQVPGDLYLLVTVLPHERFRREGDDLHLDWPVDIYTALLGGEVRVPTLSGDGVLTIPPETQAGKKFRLSGRGLPQLRHPETRGDLYVTITLRIPTQLSEREKTLVKELAALRGKK